MSAWKHCPHCLRGYTGPVCACAAVGRALRHDFSACDVLAKQGGVSLSFHTGWDAACIEVHDDIAETTAAAFLDLGGLRALEAAARDYRERITNHHTENA